MERDEKGHRAADCGGGAGVAVGNIAGTDPRADALLPLLRAALGTAVEVESCEVVKDRHDYRVVLARLQHPGLDVVIKLAGPQAVLACPFDRTAALMRRVAAETAVPVAEVVAYDVSYRDWPWRYMILTQLPGEIWFTAREKMDAAALTEAYRRLGEAVAQLHTVQFEGFGELEPGGRVVPGLPYLAALRARTAAFIPGTRSRDLFLSVLDRDAALFKEVAPASLCHEDLHGYNLLFEPHKGAWRLSGVLDFDKAWAGCAETDVARLALWRGMTAPAFWTAYEAVHPPAPGCARRRTIYQLFWCLEFARITPQHLADTAAVCRELGLAPVLTFE
jgi:fructosamine-3-kinase